MNFVQVGGFAKPIPVVHSYQSCQSSLAPDCRLGLQTLQLFPALNHTARCEVSCAVEARLSHSALAVSPQFRAHRVSLPCLFAVMGEQQGAGQVQHALLHGEIRA